MKSFFKKLSWLLLLNLLVKPAWILLIDREVQNVVGYENYGSYFSFLNLSIVLLFLADAGLSTLVSQQIASQPLTPVLPWLRTKLLLLLLYAAACAVLALASSIDHWQWFSYIILVQVLNSALLFLRSIITGLQRFGADALFSVLDKLLAIFIAAVFLYTTIWGGIGITGFLQIQAGALLFSLVAAAAYLMALRPNLEHAPASRNTVKQMIPFALIVLLMSAHARLDGFLLERLHPNGAYEAGVYAAAFRLLDAGNMIGYLAASFLMPYLSRHLGEPQLINAVVLPLRHLLLTLGLALAAFALVMAPWIQQTLYRNNSVHGANVIALCLAVLPAYYLIHVYGSVLTAADRPQFIRILSISLLINLVLNAILLTTWGAAGAAAAAICSQYYCALHCYLKGSARLEIRLMSRKLVHNLLFFGLCCAFFYAAPMVIPNVWIILATAALLILLYGLSELRWIKQNIITLL